MKTNNVILEKSFLLSVRIVKLSQYLQKRKNEFVISKQVLRSGASTGANLEEAQGASSAKDFLAKMNIVYKETRETQYWLKLLRDSAILNQIETGSILKDVDELLRICGSIIKSLKTKQKNP